MSTEWCQSCGQLKNKATTEKLWNIYHRIRDGRSSYEPLVYTSADLEEANFYGDEDSHDAVMLSMERNMAERGLCTTCARPNLAGVTPDMVMSEEDAKDMWDMWAEQAAERRAGC
jgi:hypothetical protein